MWWSSSPRRSNRFLAILALIALTAAPAGAQKTEVRIDILKDPARRIRVALPAFFDAQRPAPELAALRESLAADLRLSGFFEVITDLPPGLAADGRIGVAGGVFAFLADLARAKQEGRTREEVLAYCQARPVDGGSGALVVLLRG